MVQLPIPYCFIALLPLSAGLLLQEGHVFGEARRAWQPATVPDVRVDVFYEVLCPYSQQFFSDGLGPVWNETELRSRIDLRLYPYGNAQTQPATQVSEGFHFWHQELYQPGFDYVFNCQHGPDECFGNMIHACAIQHFADPEVYMPLFFCMMSRPSHSSEKSSFECAQALGLNISDIRTCVLGSQGNQLLNNVGVQTSNLRVRPQNESSVWVPWVLINGAHNEIAESDGNSGVRGRLLKQLCLAMQDPLPAVCAATPAAANTTEATGEAAASGGCGGSSEGSLC